MSLQNNPRTKPSQVKTLAKMLPTPKYKSHALTLKLNRKMRNLCLKPDKCTRDKDEWLRWWVKCASLYLFIQFQIQIILQHNYFISLGRLVLFPFWTLLWAFCWHLALWLGLWDFYFFFPGLYLFFQTSSLRRKVFIVCVMLSFSCMYTSDQYPVPNHTGYIRNTGAQSLTKPMVISGTVGVSSGALTLTR